MTGFQHTCKTVGLGRWFEVLIVPPQSCRGPVERLTSLRSRSQLLNARIHQSRQRGRDLRPRKDQSDRRGDRHVTRLVVEKGCRAGANGQRVRGQGELDFRTVRRAGAAQAWIALVSHSVGSGRAEIPPAESAAAGHSLELQFQHLGTHAEDPGWVAPRE